MNIERQCVKVVVVQGGNCVGYMYERRYNVTQIAPTVDVQMVVQAARLATPEVG